LLADIREPSGSIARKPKYQLKRALKQRYSLKTSSAKSEPMQAVLDLVGQVAPSRSTVLVQGKAVRVRELIAKAIHSHSPRRTSRFPSTRVPFRRTCWRLPCRPHERCLYLCHCVEEGAIRNATAAPCFWTKIGTMALDTQAKCCECCRTENLCWSAECRSIQVDVRIGRSHQWPTFDLPSVRDGFARSVFTASTYHH